MAAKFFYSGLILLGFLLVVYVSIDNDKDFPDAENTLKNINRLSNLCLLEMLISAIWWVWS